MHYEVWPGPKTGDPYEIRETTFLEGFNAFCGKTVEFVETFVEACSRCEDWNKGDRDE